MNSDLSRFFDEYRLLEKEKIDPINFLSVESFQCTLNNGKIIKREKILKNGKDGAAVIIFPITQDNKVIVACEPRVFTEKTVDVGFPAGYIEEREEALVAAKRELLEETGYSSDEFVLVGSFYQDQGCSAALNHYYIAFNCVLTSKQKLDESEFIKYFLVDFDEVKELYQNGYFKGLNSAYLIEKVSNYLNKD